METRKVAAIVSAVSGYLQMEEARPAAAARLASKPGPWAAFGRQEHMRSRLNWRTTRIRK